MEAFIARTTEHPHMGAHPPVAEMRSRANPANRARLSGPGVRSLLRILDAWDVAGGDVCAIMGYVDPAQVEDWRAGRIETLSFDQLERISLILGVHKALAMLFPDPAFARRWLGAVNRDRPFGGRSPLRFMIEGGLDGLLQTRRYLDGWRGVWP